ncbi:MAG: redoxin domain-containing protein [Phycisphaerales bacterium]|nr:redoxin domain-containing protein [Phycisphaerae bacterium]NNF42601.1 redoxin domain-containing protein [Phycisphaerales bacterium]NNM26770.1 redoxin domain-containing protein [Phycisphaerales bacterium]
MKPGPSFLVTVLLCLAIATPVPADELRNVAIGETVPAFTLRTLAGETLRSEDGRGRVVVLVYVAAEQTSSEKVMQSAAAVAGELRDERLQVIFVTADVTRVAFFRQQRDRLGLHAYPLALDLQRATYGALGLIVLPTTIIIDGDGRLRTVMASRKSDYEHVLRTHVRHALGLIDDAARDELLATKAFERSRPEDRIARHRAAARLLRRNGLRDDAERELLAALEIDPGHVDTELDLAVLDVERGKLDAASGRLRRVEATHPGHRRATLVAGMVAYHRDDLDEAERRLERALLLNPDPIRTHYYLGLVKERRGDAAAAVVHFKEALRRLLEDHS